MIRDKYQGWQDAEKVRQLRSRLESIFGCGLAERTF